MELREGWRRTGAGTGSGTAARTALATLAILAAIVLLLGPAGCSGGGDEGSGQDGQAVVQEGQGGEAGGTARAEQTAGDEPMSAGETSDVEGGGPMELVLTSTAFGPMETIPTEYTCEGDDASPPLSWQGVPEGTLAFALVVDDPDAPVGIWDHWVLYDIPAMTTELAAGAGSEERPGGGTPGRNSWDKTTYGGPCPPPGKAHRYFFKLYALSDPTGLEEGASKADLIDAMEGNVLAEAELVGTYKR